MPKWQFADHGVDTKLPVSCRPPRWKQSKNRDVGIFPSSFTDRYRSRSCPIRAKTRHDREKDKRKIAVLRRQYGASCLWKDRGIVRDLERYFGITSSPLELLGKIAMWLGEEIDIRRGRHDKRRKERIIGSPNVHYGQVAQDTPRLVVDDGDFVRAMRREEWIQYLETHPDDERRSLDVALFPCDSRPTETLFHMGIPHN
jgi:hypothetical protein